eukprot:764562-Prymnesium_polylepis.1
MTAPSELRRVRPPSAPIRAAIEPHGASQRAIECRRSVASSQGRGRAAAARAARPRDRRRRPPQVSGHPSNRVAPERPAPQSARRSSHVKLDGARSTICLPRVTAGRHHATHPSITIGLASIKWMKMKSCRMR